MYFECEWQHCHTYRGEQVARLRMGAYSTDMSSLNRRHVISYTKKQKVRNFHPPTKGQCSLSIKKTQFRKVSLYRERGRQRTHIISVTNFAQISAKHSSNVDHLCSGLKMYLKSARQSQTFNVEPSFHTSKTRQRYDVRNPSSI